MKSKGIKDAKNRPVVGISQHNIEADKNSISHFTRTPMQLRGKMPVEGDCRISEWNGGEDSSYDDRTLDVYNQSQNLVKINEMLEYGTDRSMENDPPVQTQVSEPNNHPMLFRGEQGWDLVNKGDGL